jgi:indole-3-glycerol phosphate synthase
LRVIAEVKMASPSAGRLIDDERRRALPRLYAEHGAAAISVLTECEHFLGDIRHLLEARHALDRNGSSLRPALLRKDFLFDPYHVWESRASGADALLLIVAILSDAQLRELLSLAHELEIDCLVEVHDEGELERALAAGAGIVGINNRDLHTFRVDLATTERLRPLVPAGTVVVSESGIAARADAERMARCGVDAILVGEALVRAADAGAKLQELMV